MNTKRPATHGEPMPRIWTSPLSTEATAVVRSIFCATIQPSLVAAAKGIIMPHSPSNRRAGFGAPHPAANRTSHARITFSIGELLARERLRAVGVFVQRGGERAHRRARADAQQLDAHLVPEAVD